MKEVNKKKPVRTTPYGVWEGTHSEKSEHESKQKGSSATDLQGNGYPANKQSK